MRKASTGRASALAKGALVAPWAGTCPARVLALVLAAAFVVVAGLVPTLAAAEALDEDGGAFAADVAEELDDEEDPADAEALLELVPRTTTPGIARPPRVGTLPEPPHDGLQPGDGTSRSIDRPPAGC